MITMEDYHEAADEYIQARMTDVFVTSRPRELAMEVAQLDRELNQRIYKSLPEEYRAEYTTWRLRMLALETAEWSKRKKLEERLANLKKIAKLPPNKFQMPIRKDAQHQDLFPERYVVLYTNWDAPKKFCTIHLVGTESNYTNMLDYEIYCKAAVYDLDTAEQLILVEKTRPF